MKKLDVDSLNDCLNEIATDSMKPHNPVLILNTKTGYFSIQSGLYDFNDPEKIVAKNLDIDGIPGWTNEIAETGVYIESEMDMEYFREYVLEYMENN